MVAALYETNFPDLKLARRGKVRDLYHVKLIPAIFIIDKQGIVQAIHIINVNNLEKKWIEDELKAILNGHSLISTDIQKE